MIRNWVIAIVVIANFNQIISVSARKHKIPKECPKVDPMNTTVLLSHESDCTKFYACSNGRKILMECPIMDAYGNKLYFNPKLEICDWPWKAGCHIHTTEAPEVTTTEVITTESSENSTEVTTEPAVTEASSTMSSASSTLEPTSLPTAEPATTLITTTEPPEVTSQATTEPSSPTTTTGKPTETTSQAPTKPPPSPTTAKPIETTSQAPTEPSSLPTTAKPIETTSQAPTEPPPSPTTAKPIETTSQAPTEPSSLPTTAESIETTSQAPTEPPPSPTTAKPIETTSQAPTEPPPSPTTAKPIETTSQAPTEPPPSPTTAKPIETTSQAPTEPPPSPTTAKPIETTSQAPTEPPSSPTTAKPTENTSPVTEPSSTTISTQSTQPPITIPSESSTMPELSSSTPSTSSELPIVNQTTLLPSTTIPTMIPTDDFESNGTTTTRLPSLPQCSSATAGILYPHETDCSLFYECAFDKYVLRECPQGLYFDVTHQSCVWPWESDCVPSTEPSTIHPTDPSTTQPTKPPTTKPTDPPTTQPTKPPTTQPTKPPTTKPTDPPTTIDPPSISSLCPSDNSKNGESYPHECVCNKFYVCDNGRLVVKQCPGDLHYNPILQVCDWPNQAGCNTTNNNNPTSSSTPRLSTLPSSPTPLPSSSTIQPSSSTTAEVTGRPHVSESKCPDNVSSIKIPHEINCVNYYQCNKGQKILKNCPSGLEFNADLRICDWPEYAGCSFNFSERKNNVIKVSKRAVLNSDNNGCLGSCPTSDPMKYTVLLEHEDCTKFCKCSNGNAVVFNCPPGLEYNLVDETCDFAEMAGCNRERRPVYA